MNVEQTTRVMTDKPWCEDAHETSQHYQRRLTGMVVLINRVRQRCVKRLTRAKGILLQ